MKFSLKQIVTASALLAASTAALADVTVPAGYENSATAPAGATTNTDSDGGLVFYLFNSGDTTYSVSYYLGLDLSDFTFAETDTTTLTWTISPSAYAGVDLSQMQWGVAANDNGQQITNGSTRLLTTVSSMAGASIPNNGLIPAADLLEAAVNAANGNPSALDINTVANNPQDSRNQLGNSFGIGGFTWTAAANDPSATLAMYLFAQNGGRGAGANAAFATEYAGVWSFDAATGTLSYSAVPLPAAAWLLLSALGGLGAVGRRRVAA